MRDFAPAEPKPNRLVEIFAQTDTVEYGGFKVIKQPGQNWKSAKAFVQDQEVTLTARQKQILALLISQQGQPFSILGLREALIEDYANMQDLDIANNYKVQIFKIKHSIAVQCPELAQDAEKIRSANPVSCKGETGGKHGGSVQAYYINSSEIEAVPA